MMFAYIFKKKTAVCFQKVNKLAKLDKLPSSCIYEHKKGCENNNKKNCSMKSIKG